MLGHRPYAGVPEMVSAYSRHHTLQPLPLPKAVTLREVFDLK